MQVPRLRPLGSVQPWISILGISCTHLDSTYSAIITPLWSSWVDEIVGCDGDGGMVEADFAGMAVTPLIARDFCNALFYV